MGTSMVRVGVKMASATVSKTSGYRVSVSTWQSCTSAAEGVLVLIFPMRYNMPHSASKKPCPLPKRTPASLMAPVPVAIQENFEELSPSERRLAALLLNRVEAGAALQRICEDVWVATARCAS